MPTNLAGSSGNLQKRLFVLQGTDLTSAPNPFHKSTLPAAPVSPAAPAYPGTLNAAEQAEVQRYLLNPTDVTLATLRLPDAIAKAAAYKTYYADPDALHPPNAAPTTQPAGIGPSTNKAVPNFVSRSPPARSSPKLPSAAARPSSSRFSSSTTTPRRGAPRSAAAKSSPSVQSASRLRLRRVHPGPVHRREERDRHIDRLHFPDRLSFRAPRSAPRRQPRFRRPGRRDQMDVHALQRRNARLHLDRPEQREPRRRIRPELSRHGRYSWICRLVSRLTGGVLATDLDAQLSAGYCVSPAPALT
jgi:hypothetical protein